ncbi:putative C6 finger domain protein [Aspergillus lucknowensis]|uniref:Zn(2)-C6 fungal-type domain-containing protein n=1 Tax=Aspergillus lucknowensis TaxID=176173 RepID=A0ABR4M6U8_9EURO
MENVNPISAILPDAEPRLEPTTSDELNKAEAPPKVTTGKAARKRTKTGCLTCRQRRIKCGEEKPICKNCTKSKRECKGYAQRLIFKNPLGVPGIPIPIPTQSLPFPSRYEAEIDFQLNSAGTQGPILAPKPPTNSGLAQQPTPHVLERRATDTYNADSAFAKQFSVPAQTLLPEPPATYRPAGLSDSYHQARQDSVAYADYTVDGRVHSRHAAGDLNAHGREMVDSSRPAQRPQGSVAVPLQESLGQKSGTGQNLSLSPVTPLSPWEYIDEDDDLYDVETDEEAEDQVSMQNLNQLSMVMASANRDEKQPRLFTTYLNEPNLLATYQPTFSSSPLNNPKTARIFLHFINATGPALSIFERHPIDPSTRLSGFIPMAQQGLWTYTLPLKAFEHQALQQAMLALSSLHIAYLQNAPSTVSLKHYQYALRRVGKAVGLPMRRKQLETLAATLLLAYYEVMTADHTKWNNHLAGAAQLIREVDFAGLTRDLRAQRRSRWLERGNAYGSFMDNYMFNNNTSPEDPFAELESSVDGNMVSLMLGRVVNYDQFGQVEEEGTKSRNRRLTRKDIETFRIQCDLYWWFCKQDWIQSIISGGPLFLPFSQWAQSPPRAGLGRRDAIYGTADHLTLLMGRLADFGVRDRKRKIKAAQATGSGWRPDSGFFKFMAQYGPPIPENQAPSQTPFGHPHSAASGPPPGVNPRNGSQASQGSSAGAQPTSGGPPASSPPMYGMVPPAGPRRVPAAFATTASDRDNLHGHNDEDDDVPYEEAESEWEDIFVAFDAFEQSLGPHYMPLPADTTIPIHSPFGLALQYRTHNMGNLWALYYTGRILLLRLHPSMHPAMMAAAGAAARATAIHAQTIGRIAAGIYGPQSRHYGVEGFSPTLGSCLIEVTVPLFFAGVQYMDPEQRRWTTSVLGEISRLTGWKSSDAISRGCERAWMTAAEKGGPPYEAHEERGVRQPPGWTYNTDSNANTERRFVTVRKPPYLSWAMGILSLEDHVYETAG